MEAVLMERVQEAGFLCPDACVAWLAREQCHFAEEITFGQFDDLDFGVPFSDCDFALADQVEAIPGVSLADDLVTWSIVFDVEFVGHAGEGSGGDAIEDFAFGEHLGDDCCFFDQCIASDRAIDEGQDTVGHVEDTVIVGNDDDGGLFFSGEFLEQFDNGPPALFIEGGRRFVGQDQSRLVDESASDCNALFLSTGELFWSVEQSVFETDGSKDFFGVKCLFVCGPVGVAQFDRHADVLGGI